ncbi:MAG: hypothetical protein KDD48_07065 [Bdellovibrionales bacterium]|nr:hypothetical protein [Bdellovibrionales bacterium]
MKVFRPLRFIRMSQNVIFTKSTTVTIHELKNRNFETRAITSMLYRGNYDKMFYVKQSGNPNGHDALWPKELSSQVDRRYIYLQNQQSPFGLKEQNFFSTLCNLSQGYRTKGNFPIYNSIYVKGTAVKNEDALSLLPFENDTQTSWLERIATKTDGMDWGMMIRRFQAESTITWKALAHWMTPFVQTHGSPLYVSSHIFLGDYQKTPFGVHKDSTGVIAFPICGIKRLHLWKYETLVHLCQNKSTQLSRYLDRAETISHDIDKPPDQTITMGYGDLLYWPSSMWHTGQTENFAASLHIPIRTQASLGLLVSELFQIPIDTMEFELVKTKIGPLNKDLLQNYIDNTIEILCSAIGGFELGSDMAKKWINSLVEAAATLGIDPLPTQAKKRQLSATTTLEGDIALFLAYAIDHATKELVVGLNCPPLRLPYSDELFEFFQTLKNLPTRFTVAEAIQIFNIDNETFSAGKHPLPQFLNLAVVNNVLT